MAVERYERTNRAADRSNNQTKPGPSRAGFTWAAQPETNKPPANSRPQRPTIECFQSLEETIFRSGKCPGPRDLDGLLAVDVRRGAGAGGASVSPSSDSVARRRRRRSSREREPANCAIGVASFRQSTQTGESRIGKIGKTLRQTVSVSFDFVFALTSF